MKTFRLLISLAFLLIFLTGCAAPASTPPAAATQPTAVLPAPFETSAALPPTDAPVANTPEAQPTAMPAATNTPAAQQQAQAAILPLVTPCNFTDQAISYSPSKTWVIVACQGDKPEDGITTKVARMDGSQQWSISFNDAYIQPYKPGDANMSSLLQKSFIPLNWTTDEKFVYLGVQTSSEETPFRGYDALYRLDLSSGKSRPTLKPAVGGALPTSYSFKFSPGGTKLAYLNQAIRPINIVIYDTATGDESKMTLDARFSQGGSLLWSPDEKQLLVSMLDAGQNGGNSVILYDLETMKNEYVIQHSAGVFLPLEWVGTTVYAENYPGSWAYLDMVTKEVTAAPAPTPAP